MINLNHKQIKRSILIKHAIIWLVIFVYINIGSTLDGNIFQRLIIKSVDLFNFALTYYSLNALIYPSFSKRSKAFFLIFLLFFSSVYLLLGYLNWYFVIAKLTGQTELWRQPQPVFFKGFIIMYIYIAGCAWVFYKNRVDLEQIKTSALKDRVLIAKELDFLKSQFNSHLIFNFLNFCYSNVYKISDKSATVIDVFSEMLEFTLKSDKSASITMEQEIKYLNNYIELKKILYPKIAFDFRYSIETYNAKVIPGLLSSLLDINFSAHNDIEENTRLNIKLTEEHGTLRFKIENQNFKNISFKENHNDSEYLKESLEKFYKEKYQLETSSTKSNSYIQELVLSLDSSQSI